MTYSEVQRIDDLSRLRVLKKGYILIAKHLREGTHQNNVVTLRYLKACDTVDRLHWRIKEITDG